MLAFTVYGVQMGVLISSLFLARMVEASKATKMNGEKLVPTFQMCSSVELLLRRVRLLPSWGEVVFLLHNV